MREVAVAIMLEALYQQQNAVPGLRPLVDRRAWYIFIGRLVQEATTP